MRKIRGRAGGGEGWRRACVFYGRRVHEKNTGLLLTPIDLNTHERIPWVYLLLRDGVLLRNVPRVETLVQHDHGVLACHFPSTPSRLLPRPLLPFPPISPTRKISPPPRTLCIHARNQRDGRAEPFLPHTFLSLLVDPMTAAIVTADDSFPLTHSTSGIMCAGEKKCIPITLAGLSHRHKGSGAHKNWD